MVLGNKAEKQKALDDEDDGDSDDKKVLLGINLGFKEQAEIVNQLFNLINLVFTVDPETPSVIVNYPSLSQMLERGMMLSENRYLRENMSKRIQYILINMHTTASQSAAEAAASAASVPASDGSVICFKTIMDYLLTSMFDKSKDPKNESRYSEVIDHVCIVLAVLEPRDLEVLQNQVLGLIE